MAECCLEELPQSSFDNESTLINEVETSPTHSVPTIEDNGISIPQYAPLLFSSFIEQSSQTLLNLCLFQDQVVIAQDRLAKSTLVFDGLVKFGIYLESNGSTVFSKIVFSKNDLSTTFLFLNSAEAQLWYMKLLELGIPQLVQVGYPTFEQQQQFMQQQLMNALLAKEQEKVKTHSRKPSIFKYESMNIPYQGVYNTFNQSNQSTNKRFAKSSSDIQSFFYKLILTRHLRGNFQQDALVLQQIML